MGLEQDLANLIAEELTEVDKRKDCLGRAALSLAEFNLNSATYVVYLRSLWADHGEKSVEVSYKGNIRDAIKKAESKFMRENNRSGIQAEYTVEVKVDDLSFDVPGKYWRKYCTRKR